MRLRKPCEHGRYEQHWRNHDRPYHDDNICPGGEFLPEDALVIEKVDEFAGEFGLRMMRRGLGYMEPQALLLNMFDALAADQVGEPG